MILISFRRILILIVVSVGGAFAVPSVIAAVAPLAWLEPPRRSSVGVAVRVNGIILPGTELEPKPLDDRLAKVVLRVVDIYPHGTARRYNLSYYGLEPGTFDLRDSLKRQDGGSTSDLPPIPVLIEARLPPGQVEPNSLRATASSFRGGYRLLMFLATVAWFAGLLAIVFARRQARRAGMVVEQPPLTLADRLRPLVDRAMRGNLEPGERAELERSLIDYWRRRLGLETVNPGQAIALIRADPAAGTLLRQLEAWLHQPPGEAADVDLATLLEPYRDLAGDGSPVPAGEPVPEGQPA